MFKTNINHHDVSKAKTSVAKGDRLIVIDSNATSQPNGTIIVFDGDALGNRIIGRFYTSRYAKLTPATAGNTPVGTVVYVEKSDGGGGAKKGTFHKVTNQGGNCKSNDCVGLDGKVCCHLTNLSVAVQLGFETQVATLVAPAPAAKVLPQVGDRIKMIDNGGFYDYGKNGDLGTVVQPKEYMPSSATTPLVALKMDDGKSFNCYASRVTVVCLAKDVIVAPPAPPVTVIDEMVTPLHYTRILHAIEEAEGIFSCYFRKSDGNMRSISGQLCNHNDKAGSFITVQEWDAEGTALFEAGKLKYRQVNMSTIKRLTINNINYVIKD